MDKLAVKALKKDEATNYVSILQKLLPVEVTAAYLALRSLFNQLDKATTSDLVLLIGFAVALAVIFYFVLERGFGVKSQLHRFFYCACFLVWAANIETDKIKLIIGSHYYPIIIGAITILISFAVPYYLPRKRLVH